MIRVPPLVEVVLAFVAGAATFALAGIVLAGTDSDLVAVLLGVVYVVAVIAVTRFVGIAYAVPVAMAGFLAYDWYQLPPTHPLEFPDLANLVDLLVYLSIAILIGQLAAHAARRAEASERALGAIADEQAALRRVATLVARGVPPSEVFGAVAREVGLLLGVDATYMTRYEPDGTATEVGSWSPDGRETLDIRSSVAAPILVEGRRWGAMIASSRWDRPLPSDTESRINAFTELVATAISNAEARSDLAASRARVVAAADEERRRVVRDLHDGAQQRLVHTVLTLKLAQRAIENGDRPSTALVTEALGEAERATAELRELAHGILPSVLTRGGLKEGLQALASRMPLPVEVDLSVERLAPAVEATAYFFVGEALTNVAKHSRAGRAEVVARVEHGKLRLHVRDDGIGGAEPDGSGLLGLADRLAVLGGKLHVGSPADGGTIVAATIPLSS